MVKTAEMGARKSGEKVSGFAATCNLLSQYLKERGGLRDLGLGLSAAAPALPLAGARGKQEVPKTMNLLPGVETVVGELDGAAVNVGAASDRRKDPVLSMDLFPHHAGLGPSDEKNPDLMRETRRAQMTIFYGGKVMVFDNVPAEKVGELMVMAGRGCPSPTQPSKAEQPPPAQPNPAVAASAALASNSEAKPAAPTAAVATLAVSAQDAPKKPTQPAASDLPIARRVSLHRFLEKRKDRISANAPYPVSGSPASFASSPEKNRGQWLGLASHASAKL
ncbi:hypothetical protein Taro_020269 [Colocasia esculenta]|uniref:Protein TIFY n=1 Tax=Colocasia esculenta TaxID=4460 RepID=A0A843V4Q3_COLES|nr:hypothetical protein [Colocasia esculenta]